MKHSVWLFSEPISATILWFNVTCDWPTTAAATAHTVWVGLRAVQYGHCIQLDASNELFYGEALLFETIPISCISHAERVLAGFCCVDEKSWCACSCPFEGDQSGDRTAPPRQPLPFKTPPWAQPGHRGQIGACQTWQQVILLELVRQLQAPSKVMCSVQKQQDYLWSLTHRWNCESFKPLRSRHEHWGCLFWHLLSVPCLRAGFAQSSCTNSLFISYTSSIIKRLRKKGWFVWTKSINPYFPDHLCKCNVWTNTTCCYYCCQKN